MGKCKKIGICKKIGRLCKIRTQASYTVENAVIVPLFVIIIISMIFCAFYLHDSVILKCAAIKTAINLKNEIITGKSDENTGRSTDKIEISAVDYLRQKTLLLKGIKTDVEIQEGISGKKIKVICTGKIWTLLLNRSGKVQIEKNVLTDASGPGDFIRKCRAAEALYKSYVSERKGK